MFPVYLLPMCPVHTCPLASAACRKSFRPSGAKDDQPDAKLLLQMLRAHHDALTPLADLGTDQTRLLDKLVLHRRRLIDQRTALANKLRAALKSYFPQALKVMPGSLLSFNLPRRSCL